MKVAVARKLLIRGYILLRDGIDYAEFLRRGVEAEARPGLQHRLSCLGFVIGRPASRARSGSADRTSWASECPDK